MKLHAEFQKYNFFRSPAWRWERVLHLAERFPTPGRATRKDDQFVKAARVFLCSLKKKTTDAERAELWSENPALFYAYEFNDRQDEHPEGAMFIQARLLARQSYEDIAESLSTIPDAIRWYEALYFNVVDRIHQRDWITKHVLLPALVRHHSIASNDPGDESIDGAVARPFMDGSLKLFAYFGGAHIVDVMITGFQSGKTLTSPDAINEWFDSNYSMTIRRRSHQAAMLFRVNKFNVMQLFEHHNRIMEIERSDEAREKMRSAEEAHIKALIDEIPWMYGEKGEKASAGTPLHLYDGGASELRDDEVMRVAAGEQIDVKKTVWMDKLPAPRKNQAALAHKKELDL
jgi:hypothetical protein